LSPGAPLAPGPQAQRRKKAVCNKNKTQYNIPMRKTAAKLKAPDDEKDRKLIVKESKRDLEDLLNEPGPLDNLADLVKALKKAKKK